MLALEELSVKIKDMFVILGKCLSLVKYNIV